MEYAIPGKVRKSEMSNEIRNESGNKKWVIGVKRAFKSSVVYIMSYVYLLVCEDNSTYVGATVDLDKRLRQHNKEIKGGATATSNKVVKGLTWHRACHVSGFPDWPAALQFEWRWKQLSRKLPSRMFPLERRLLALRELLSLERPTTKAIPYVEWDSPPQVHLESCDARRLFPHL